MMFCRFVSLLILVMGLVFAAGPMSLTASAGGCETAMTMSAVEPVPCHNNKTHNPVPCMMAGACLLHHGAFAAQDADAPLAVVFEWPVELHLQETRPLIGVGAEPPFEPPRNNA